MNEVLETINEHKKLLELLGYTLDLKNNEIPLYKPTSILNGGKIVGKLSIERVNLYFLKKDKKNVGNMDLNSMYFGKDKEKNMKTMVHIILKDKNLNIDCYNRPININNDENEFIEISDKNFKIRMNNRMVKQIEYRDSEIILIVHFLDSQHISVTYINDKEQYDYTGDVIEVTGVLNYKLENTIGNKFLKKLFNIVCSQNNQDIKKNVYKPE